jgi:hypothetical protein
MPVIWARPAAWAASAAATSCGQSAAVAPPRDMPVSALRCSRAGRPARLAAAATACTRLAEPTDRSIPFRMASVWSPSGAANTTSTRAVMPASRRASASLVCTTPSHFAPPASAAVATGIMPQP